MIQQRGMTTRFGAGRRSAWPVAVAVVVLFSLGFSVGCASVTPSVLDVTDRHLRNPERSAMSADYDVLVGEMAARDGQFDEARAAFDRAVQKDPESGYLRFRLARLEAQTDDLVAALLHAERGLELEPSSVDGRLLLGRLYRIDRNPGGVERVLRDATGDPVSPMAALMLYQVYLESGRMEEALAVVNGLLAEAPEDLAAYMAAATVYERMKDYAQAEAVLRKALDHHPNRFVIYSRLARLRRAAGDRPGEIEIYQEVLAEYPDHYGTLVSLGEAQIAESDIEGAVETYSRISALFPEDLQIIRRLASLEFGAGHYEAAANRLSTALERHPEHFEFAYRLGQVQRGLGRNQEALVTLESIPRTHPLYVEARMQIAVVLETDGELEAALIEVEALRELRPGRGLDFHAASLRARIGDYDGGAAILQELLDETPNDEDVLYQLGVLAGLVQRVEEALGYMHQVLEQNPNNAQALNYIGYTWAERGERLD
jgi:tetratricopeptide (TPR) repeat protein